MIVRDDENPGDLCARIRHTYVRYSGKRKEGRSTRFESERCDFKVLFGDVTQDFFDKNLFSRRLSALLPLQRYCRESTSIHE